MPRYVELFPKVLFRSRNPAPFRAIVIGNCQAQYLAPLFELALADCSCDYLFCHEISSEIQHAAVENYLDEQRDNYNLVIAQPLGPDWKAIAKDGLIARFGRDRTLFVLNIHFNGTHPDITTLGELQTRILSPMGGPHSRIALGGWVAGLSIDQIIAMFDQKSIEKLGYLLSFEESARELGDREKSCDTKFSDQIVKLAKSAFSFYTFNHPTPNILISYVSHISYLLNLNKQAQPSGVALNAMLSAETLAPNGIWPVYPELKDLLAPNFPISTRFILPDHGRGAAVISRESFVSRSLAIYDSVGREKISMLRQAQNSHDLISQLL